MDAEEQRQRRRQRLVRLREDHGKLWGLVGESPLTWAALVVAAATALQPQVSHVITDLPWPHHLGEDFIMAALLALYVLGTTTAAGRRAGGGPVRAHQRDRRRQRQAAGDRLPERAGPPV